MHPIAYLTTAWVNTFVPITDNIYLLSLVAISLIVHIIATSKNTRYMHVCGYIVAHLTLGTYVELVFALA